MPPKVIIRTPYASSSSSSSSSSTSTREDGTQGQGLVGDVSSLFKQRLSQRENELLARALQGPNAFATLCAGTDAAVLCFQNLANTYNAAGLSHAFACESNPEKQRFIETMFEGTIRFLFSDVHDLASGVAFDTLSCSRASVPAVVGIVAGFPCQDASALNHRSRESASRSCIAGGSHRTGSVFESICKFVWTRPQVEWLILENVAALASPPQGSDEPSNLDFVVHKLAELGFRTITFMLDPTMFGQLSSRKRLFMLSVRDKLVQNAGWSAADFESHAIAIMNKLVGLPSCQLDDALLDEGHPLVRSTEATAAAPKKRTLRESVTWPQEHLDWASRKGFKWWCPNPLTQAATMEKFRGLFELTERQLDLLALNGFTLPMEDVVCLDVNLSCKWSRPCAGRTPCLTSTSQIYIGHRGRLLLGAEALRVMGIIYPNEMKLERFKGGLLKNLAGNAFDAASCTAAMIVMMLTLTELKDEGGRRHDDDDSRDGVR
jgi:site-specific DNA-cytosine methylase